MSGKSTWTNSPPSPRQPLNWIATPSSWRWLCTRQWTRASRSQRRCWPGGPASESPRSLVLAGWPAIFLNDAGAVIASGVWRCSLAARRRRRRRWNRPVGERSVRSAPVPDGPRTFPRAPGPSDRTGARVSRPTMCADEAIRWWTMRRMRSPLAGALPVRTVLGVRLRDRPWRAGRPDRPVRADPTAA